MTKFSAAQQSQLAQIGAFLRENREVQGKSLEDIAIHTYIRPQLLSGIETGNPDLLPEPIFVQGFIRRYADNLGLKGIELSQQFTVNSIPSTPRPVRPLEMPESSSTKRITRKKVTETNGIAANGIVANGTVANGAVASGANSTVANGAVANGTSNTNGANGAVANGSSLSAVNSTPSFTVDSLPANSLSADIPLSVNDTETQTAILAPDTSELATPELDTSGLNLSEPADDETPVISSEFESTVEEGAVEEGAVEKGAVENSLTEESAATNDLSSKVAEFDQINLASPTTEETISVGSAPLEEASSEKTGLEETSLRHVNSEDAELNKRAIENDGLEDDSSEDTDLENFRLENLSADDAALQPLQFNDELPAPSTAEIDSVAKGAVPEMTPNLTPAAVPTAAPKANIPGVAYSPAPVGVEMDATDGGPNLKLLAIGAVFIAAVTAGVVLIANMLGGSEQQPSVVDTPEATSTEQVIEPPPPVEEPAVPPVSSAPIYVEATATSEAWVSIIADGNSLLFEGTLNPGDTKLWEAQETLSIYSGNAGALQLARNGEAAEVMGTGGQPQEKVFTLE